MVFTKVSLTEIFLSGNFQMFFHAELTNFANFWPLQNFLQYFSTNSKTGKTEFKFFWDFSMCTTYVKTFASIPDDTCSFCNCWTQLTFSQKFVSRMLMYQLANNLKYVIGCWISYDFLLKNVLTWFFIGRTCEFKIWYRFSLPFIHFSKLFINI